MNLITIDINNILTKAEIIKLLEDNNLIISDYDKISLESPYINNLKGVDSYPLDVDLVVDNQKVEFKFIINVIEGSYYEDIKNDYKITFIAAIILLIFISSFITYKIIRKRRIKKSKK